MRRLVRSTALLGVGSAATVVAAVLRAKVLAALDESFGRMGKGLGGAMGGMMMAPGAVGGELQPAGEPAGVGEEEEEDPPIQRIQFHLDMGALRGSSLGGLLEMGMAMWQASAEGEENTACLFGLLGKVNTVFADVTMGDGGEPSAMVISIKSTAAKDEVLTCVRGMADEGQTFEEVPVGSATGYTMRKADEPIKAVLVEASPGNWLFGIPANVEAALGTDPEADATFQALVAPLGPSVMRITVLFKPEFAQLADSIDADAPPQAACLRGVFQAAKGGSLGLALSPNFTLALALQNGSATQAAETQACLSGLWGLAKPALLAEIGEAGAAQIETLLGLSVAQLLDSVKIEASSDFAKVSVSLPAEVINRLIEMAAQLAQMGGGA